jgi:hypothetical protein
MFLASANKSSALFLSDQSIQKINSTALYLVSGRTSLDGLLDFAEGSCKFNQHDFAPSF